MLLIKMTSFQEDLDSSERKERERERERERESVSVLVLDCRVAEAVFPHCVWTGIQF